MCGNFTPNRHPGDSQLTSPTTVALNQHADRVPTEVPVEHARGGSDATLEFVADHSGSAADITLLERATVGRVKGMKNVLRLHMKSVHVVQLIVGSLGDNWQRPEIAFLVRRPAPD